MKWTFRTISFSLVLALLIGGIALAFPISMAKAATLADITPPLTSEEKSLEQAKNSHPGMERAYTLELKVLDRQAKFLVRGEKIIGKAEEIISKLKSNGKDTSVLEAALAQFKKDVVKAEKAHDKAAGILTTHAGFDQNGKVVDAVQAKQTLVSARDNLKEFRAILKDSLGDVRKVIKDFRKDNQARNPKS
jgi:predicted DNA binding protein